MKARIPSATILLIMLTAALPPAGWAGLPMAEKVAPQPIATSVAAASLQEDTTPPEISNVQASARYIWPQGCLSPAAEPTEVTIRADVTDASGLEWVRLDYEEYGSPTFVTMDLESGNTYAATLGPFDEYDAIWNLHVKARDAAGNESQSPEIYVDVNPCPTVWSNVRESADPIYREGCPEPTQITILVDITIVLGLDSMVDFHLAPGWSCAVSGQLDLPQWPGVYPDQELIVGPCSEAGTYEYWWSAYDGLQLTNYSDRYTFTVQDCPIAPSPPDNVQASDCTHTDKVRVTWESVPGASDYDVYRATSPGGAFQISG